MGPEPVRSGERGLVTTELAVLFPVVMVVVLLIVHTAMWAHANAVAQAAAEHGADVAAAFGAEPDDGRLAAERFLEVAGQVGGAIVIVTPSRTEVKVRVIGTYPGVFGRLEVRASSTSVIERVPQP